MVTKDLFQFKYERSVLRGILLIDDDEEEEDD